MNHTELIARLSAMWAQLDPVDEWRPVIRDAIDALAQPAAPAADIDEAQIARMHEQGAVAWAGVDAADLRAGGDGLPAAPVAPAEPASEPVAPDDPHAFSRRCAAAELERGPWGKHAAPQPAPARVPTDLLRVAIGTLAHDRMGGCPDDVEGWHVRDPQCPACRAIVAAESAQGDPK